MTSGEGRRAPVAEERMVGGRGFEAERTCGVGPCSETPARQPVLSGPRADQASNVARRRAPRQGPRSMAQASSPPR